MKRKKLEDYFAPAKKIKKDKLITCELCGKQVIQNFIKVHKCSLNKTSPEQKNMKNAFKFIMSTSQETIKENFHLNYTGKTEGRHHWEYFFINPESYSYKSKVHKLKLDSSATQEIQLTFTTNHVTSPISYSSMKPLPSFSPSILKSILHKAVRRKNYRSSIKTALQFGCNCG